MTVCPRALVALVCGASVFAAAPVKLIIDTDAGFDVDDVGAISIGNALQDSGEAEIVAVGHTNGFTKGIGGVSALMAFYGPSRAKSASRSLRRALLMPQVKPGHTLSLRQ